MMTLFWLKLRPVKHTDTKPGVQRTQGNGQPIMEPVRGFRSLSWSDSFGYISGRQGARTGTKEREQEKEPKNRKQKTTCFAGGVASAYSTKITFPLE